MITSAKPQPWPGKASPPCARTRVLIVDDHVVVRQGVASLLGHHAFLEVVGEAEDGLDGLAKARELSPDVVVADLTLPKLDGLALTKTLHAQLPEIKVVILSMHAPERVAQAVLKSGARGHVSKEAATGQLGEAMETVASGGTFFGSGFTRSGVDGRAQNGIRQPRKPLSLREF